MKKILCILLALMVSLMIMPASAEDAEDADALDILDETEEAADDEELPIQVLELTLNKDGSSTSVYTMPAPKEYEDQIDGIIDDYSDKGIETETIDDYHGFKAIKLTQERTADQPCSVAIPGEDSMAYEAWVVDGLFTNKVIMNATYDLTNSGYEDGEEIAQIIVHLPSKASEHNAEKVDGKTYEWTLEGGKATSIRFIYSKTSLSDLITCAAILCIAL